MKKLLLATVATIALTATGFAAEQKGQAAGGAGVEMKAGGQATGQTTNSGMKADSKAGADIKANEHKGAAEMKSDADTKGSASTKSRGETTGQGGASEPKATTEPRSEQRPGAGSDQRHGSGMNRTEQREQRQPGSNASETNRTGAQGQGTAQGTQNGGTAAARTEASGSVNLSADQKTKIRTTVIQSASAPKIERSQINFTLNVGTVVPRTVKVVAVPATLVEIHPAWRGYSYFIVGDELVIVEPRTLKIVAVIIV
jgi:hypothetical protein